MKIHKITFSTILLLGTIILSQPKNAYAFVTTDVLETAGRIAATVGDVLRIGGINLEKGENKATADKTGEGTAETEAYIEKVNQDINNQSNAAQSSEQSGFKYWSGKVTTWATDFAKKRLKTGNKDKQKIRDNALRLAEIEAEILELNLRLTLVDSERKLYYNTVDRLYQEKLALYEQNKRKVLAKTQKLNVMALAQEKVAEYKTKIKAEIDAKLNDKLADVQAKIAEAGAYYNKSKEAIEKANVEQKEYWSKELAKANTEYVATESELKELLKQLETAKASQQDATQIELDIKEKTKRYHELKKQVEVEIPEKQKKAEENTLSDLNSALTDFEISKQKFIEGYAQAQAEAEIEMQEKIAQFASSTLGYDINKSEDKKGKIEDEMAELEKQINEAKAKGEDTSAMEAEILALQTEYNLIEEVSVGSLLDGSFAQDKASDLISSMEDEITKSLSGILDLKASYEDSFNIRIRDIHNQIKTLKELRAVLQKELASQTAKFALKSLFKIDLDDPNNALTQAYKLNYLDKNKPESAENIDEIRRNRFIERRDAYLSSYADAVMLKLRLGNDMPVIEHFADNTNSMDTVSGVIGADTDIKIKTIEALMQYAELLVAELRMITATELANLNTYKVKNPDKDITNFNLDDYLYNCSLD